MAALFVSRGPKAFSQCRAVAILTLAILTLSGGCSNSDNTAPDTPAGPGGTLKVQSFSGAQSCSELERNIEDTAISMMTESLRQFASPVPIAQPEVGAPTVGAPAGDSASPAPAPGNGSAPGTPAFSDTNVRQVGVDEPDPVKNDGSRLFALREDSTGLTLSHLRLTPADAMSVVGQRSLSAANPDTQDIETGTGLFLLDSDRVAVLTTSSQRYSIEPAPGVFTDSVPAITSAGTTTLLTGAPTLLSPPVCVDNGCGPGGSIQAEPRTRLRLFDTPATGAPTEAWQLDIGGRLLQARRVGQRIYLVTQADLALPDGVRFYPDIDRGPNPDGSSAWREALETLIASNTRLIRDQSLAQWLAALDVRESRDGGPPTARITGEPDAARCATYARVDTETRLAWLQVSTVDVGARDLTQQTLLANGTGVYMSNRSLFVFTPWWQRASAEPGTTTSTSGQVTLLHRFALDEQGQAIYRASGSFSGRLINDYAIDENGAGTIHIAAQANAREIHTYLASLQESGDTLAIVGRSDPIAPGETLQSARFVGDRAYLVTFRVVDPFFVWDLSNPSAPRQLGELKIPGFSSYLHPVDDTHLLGIGYDVGERTRRIKASLFDVTDPTNPREQSVLLLGDVFTGSAALWDPHAFTFFQPDPTSSVSIGAIPVRSYPYNDGPQRVESQSGVRLIDIDPARGAAALRLAGTLDMTDLLGSAVPGNGWRAFDARRAIFIGNTVYGVADGAVRAAPSATPGAPIATLVIP